MQLTIDPRYCCPYLGADNDPETPFAFPTRHSACYRTGTPRAIELEHQTEFCLSENHVNCFLFAGEDKPETETVDLVEEQQEIVRPANSAVPEDGAAPEDSPPTGFQRFMRYYLAVTGGLIILLVVAALVLLLKNNLWPRVIRPFIWPPTTTASLMPETESLLSTQSTATAVPETTLPPPTTTVSATGTPTPTESVSPTPPFQVAAEATLAFESNLRTGPGTEYDAVVYLNKGTKVDILARNVDGTWLYVQAGTGVEGWLAATQVNEDLDIDSFPLTPTRAAPEDTGAPEDD